jgi:CheY-like chemotaxis protein
MGGSVRVESSVGTGSKFIFTVRARVAKGPERGEPGAPDPTLRLLVIDEDEISLGDFTDFASRLGLSAVSARSAEEAGRIEDFAKNPPDICFIGTISAGGSAKDAVARIRAGAPGAKIALLIYEADRTYWADRTGPIQADAARPEQADARQDGEAAEADAFLPKPFFPSDILRVLRECFRTESEDAKSPDGELPNDSERAPREDEFRGRRILLAEDVDVNREIVASMLEGSGIEITEAPNGRIAVELFKADPDAFDLIFMDVQMPELDGYGATSEIRALGAARAKSVPIIAMTANVFQEDVNRCLDIGMNDHIGKPFNLSQITGILRKYFGKR